MFDEKNLLDEKSIFDGITEQDLNPFTQDNEIDEVKNLNTFKNAPILEFPEPVLLEVGRYDCYITEPNNVLKKLISEGNGIRPERLGTVKIHYVGKQIDGEQFDSSYEREQPTTFKVLFLVFLFGFFQIGSGDVIKGWDVAVVSMKVGEKAEFEIKPEFCVGGETSFLTTPPGY
ncbi:hypothetical protein FACS189472_14700 [Alphaproteobacteria bacterium]|nr:hypothetical protein FACS189472_14700 [Alphaproteobacteria bacterium]